MRLKDHLNKLEYFSIVAETGSLKKASEKALIGQPQLSKVIQQLEDILGVTLLVRSVKGVNLTKEGNILLQHTRNILKEVNKAEFSIQSLDQNIKGSVNIGTYDSIARYFFPEFLKYLKINMPDINVFLETGKSQDILKKLSKKDVDMAVVVAPDKLNKKIKSKTIYTDTFGLYKAPNMSNDFNDNLIYFPFPMNETEQAMRRFGFQESISCDNMETVKSLTEQSLGVGLLPHRVAKESVLSKKLIEFTHPKIKTNSFDPHDIIMCGAESTSLAQNYVMEEIERFLNLWYNN
ncbi:MAG: LysR family transcriptional regulator [Bdellovibrionales bacterium]|nr:LysR family transcriptional regulator [Bdellovibrionales bacterium]NQZ17859.1 LysR family transcriptional regulator [Bdellovibrionales bacterium]